MLEACQLDPSEQKLLSVRIGKGAYLSRKRVVGICRAQEQLARNKSEIFNPYYALDRKALIDEALVSKSTHAKTVPAGLLFKPSRRRGHPSDHIVTGMTRAEDG